MSYNIHIQRQEISALFDLKGPSEALQEWAGKHLPVFPSHPNSKTIKDEMELSFIGRNHWILRAPLSQEQSLAGRLMPESCPSDISIVRISDTLTFFGISGPDAPEVMAIACPLDLHASVFLEGMITYSEVFGIKALVSHYDGGFEFAVEQSFGDMIVDYLNRAIT